MVRTARKPSPLPVHPEDRAHLAAAALGTAPHLEGGRFVTRSGRQLSAAGQAYWRQQVASGRFDTSGHRATHKPMLPLAFAPQNRPNPTITPTQIAKAINKQTGIYDLVRPFVGVGKSVRHGRAPSRKDLATSLATIMPSGRGGPRGMLSEEQIAALKSEMVGHPQHSEQLAALTIASMRNPGAFEEPYVGGMNLTGGHQNPDPLETAYQLQAIRDWIAGVGQQPNWPNRGGFPQVQGPYPLPELAQLARRGMIPGLGPHGRKSYTKPGMFSAPGHFWARNQ